MKLPRDISADELVKSLHRRGCVVTRQKGSHIRVTTLNGGEHHEVIPNRNPPKVGTFSKILKSITDHHKISVGELLNQPELR